MSGLGMLAQVFEVLVRIIGKYVRGEMKRPEFMEAWTAMGTAVDVIAKDIQGPITIGRIAASKGGQRGGPARAASMTAAQRTAQARHAANQRWLG